MIKRICIGFCLLLGLSQIVYAQGSMSDEQIMQYVLAETQKGTSQMEIVSSLISKGVSVEQLQKLQKKYENQKKGGVLGLKEQTEMSRSREKVISKKVNQKGGFLNKEVEPEDLSGMSAYEREQYLMKKKYAYLNGMGGMMSDSEDFLFGFSDDDDEKDRSLRIFGHDIFQNKFLTFETDLNIPAPDNYLLGAGDKVFVDVTGVSQKSFDGEISPEGILYIEGYASVRIGGLTVAQANNAVRNAIGKYFAGSKVELTVGQTRSITVNVAGEVKSPGTYTLSSFATVFHALYMAGGANDIGTLRNIKVYRNNRLISTVDLYDFILNGQMPGNIRLESNDMIVVGPYESLVQITGKVKRPMFYEMRATESLATLLKYAGGFSGDAYQKQVRLIRKNSGMKEVFSVGEFQMGTFKLADGDSVFVDSVLNRYANMVEVKGAVYRSGMYQVGSDISTVGQLVEAAGGLTDDAFGERAVLHRKKDNGTLEVIPLSIGAILKHEVTDVALKNEDVLFIPGLKDSYEERTLTIAGEVFYPGVYQYAENTTIEDLVLQAGGLKDAASVVKVDVSRRIRNKATLSASEISCENFTLSLKDGFVVDGEPGFKLQPFDEVFVRRSPGYIEQKHVSIEGEVAFSGTYTLTGKGQRLSDLVEMAGGFTPNAYLKGARLIRTVADAERMKQQALRKFLTSNDSSEIKKFELNSTRSVGIHLDKAMENRGNDEWDLVLQEGDRLVVPQISNTVTINGEVMCPNSVAYVPGEGLSYYINQAGGYSAKAKKNRVFVVHMNGTVSRLRRAKDIQPGCEIVVPAKQPKPYRVSVTEILSIGTSLATLATVIATLVK